MNTKLGIGTGQGSRGWELYITSVVMVILSGLFVSLRLLQRKTTSKLDLDDYTSLFALVIVDAHLLLYNVVCLLLTYLGFIHCTFNNRILGRQTRLRPAK